MGSIAGTAGRALRRRVSHPRQGDDHAAGGRARGQRVQTTQMTNPV